MPSMKWAFLASAFIFANAASAILSPDAASAAAEGPTGLWDRDDGLGGVRISPCGASLCGHVTWLRDKQGPGKIGQRVFYDMHRTTDNTWTGFAVNPADGHVYSGSLILAGSHLVTRGCVLGGMVCGNLGLTRSH